jgi:hypothetical protein
VFGRLVEAGLVDRAEIGLAGEPSSGESARWRNWGQEVAGSSREDGIRLIEELQQAQRRIVELERGPTCRCGMAPVVDSQATGVESFCEFAADPGVRFDGRPAFEA